MSNVILPPGIVDTGEDRVLFLAGPIQGAENWQDVAIELISELDNSVIVASPRKEYSEGEFVYEKQVDWEKEFLRRAADNGVIIFWLARQSDAGPTDERGFHRSYAQTSRFELAEWLTRSQYEDVRVIVGIEEGFGNARYISKRIADDFPNVTVCESLEETIDIAINIIHNK